MIASPAPPRRRSVRFALTSLLMIVVGAVVFVPKEWVEETTNNRFLGVLAGGVLPFLLGLWLAPKISYRRRDAFFLLALGCLNGIAFLVVWMPAWRLAHLPHRDWPLRPEEIAAGRHTTYVEPAPEAKAEPHPPPPPPRPPWARDVTDDWQPKRSSRGVPEKGPFSMKTAPHQPSEGPFS